MRIYHVSPRHISMNTCHTNTHTHMDQNPPKTVCLIVSFVMHAHITYIHTTNKYTHMNPVHTCTARPHFTSPHRANSCSIYASMVQTDSPGASPCTYTVAYKKQTHARTGLLATIYVQPTCNSAVMQASKPTLIFGMRHVGILCIYGWTKFVEGSMQYDIWQNK